MFKSSAARTTKNGEGIKLPRWIRRLGWGVWSGWPEHAYHDERYQQRLLVVQEHLAACLDVAPQGPLRLVSLCAGDGRDVIGVLASHKRRNDVAARLVELNRQSVATGDRQTANTGQQNTVSFLNEDATLYATYKIIVPADIVLSCGVWGHVPTHERMLLVRAMASFCKPGGTVIWTRGVSKGMTRLDEIQSLFTASAWDEVRVSLTPDRDWTVATYRYRGPSIELPQHGQIFHFQRNAGR